jgi:hypothetical protein
MEDVHYDLGLADMLAGDPTTLSVSEGDLSEVLRDLGSSGNTPQHAQGGSTPSTRRFNPFYMGAPPHGSRSGSGERPSSAGAAAGASGGSGGAGSGGGVLDFGSSGRGGGMRPPSVALPLPPWSPALPSSGSGSDKASRSTPGSGGSGVDPLALHHGGVLGRGSLDGTPGLLGRLEGEDMLGGAPGPLELRGLRTPSMVGGRVQGGQVVAGVREGVRGWLMLGPRPVFPGG